MKAINSVAIAVSLNKSTDILQQRNHSLKYLFSCHHKVGIIRGKFIESTILIYCICDDSIIISPSENLETYLATAR